jgi:hypothetical protein
VSVAQVITWYLEERAPALLDLPSFIGRDDGLLHASGAGGDPESRSPPGF